MSINKTEAELMEEINLLDRAIKAKKSTAYAARPHPYAAPHYKSAAYGRNTYAPGPSRPFTQPQHRNVILDGVAFEGNSRKLVRKGVQNPAPTSKTAPSAVTSTQPSAPVAPQAGMVRLTNGSLVAAHRVRAKLPAPPPPEVLAAKAARLAKHTMVLNSMQAARNRSGKRPRHTTLVKKQDKPCRFFTKTGICTKGLICPYTHDPTKTAICPRFLAGNCPNAESCALSHDPTPQRVPLCLHFANAGRCKNGENCVYPHVRVGVKYGVCRDFAVLGYCEKGLDCDKQHVKECPDFADTGVCTTEGCKLPHVIRAKQDRAIRSPTIGSTTIKATPSVQAIQVKSVPAKGISGVTSGPKGGAADEFISLTFLESSEDDLEEAEEEELSEEDKHEENVQMDEQESSSEVEDAIVEDIL